MGGANGSQSELDAIYPELESMYNSYSLHINLTGANLRVHYYYHIALRWQEKAAKMLMRIKEDGPDEEIFAACAVVL